MNRTLKRIIWVLLSNLMMGCGGTLSWLSNLGLDPVACMNYGVSGVLGLRYGVYQVAFNIILFIPVFIMDKRSFGLGTIANMTIPGFFMQFMMAHLTASGISPETTHERILFRIICLTAGILINTFAVAIYMSCDMGVGPYDRVGVIIERKTKGRLTYRPARIIQDLIAVGIGFLTGSMVGIGTAIMGFFVGPLIVFFRTHITDRMVSYKPPEN